MTTEIDSLVEELKRYDNQEGYEMGHKEVENRLGPGMQKERMP